MNRDFAEWLARERMPRFNIRRLSIEELWRDGYFAAEAYEVMSKTPEYVLIFDCSLRELPSMIAGHFHFLRSAVGELAVKAACNDLATNEHAISAGPMTEELAFVVREGIRGLSVVLSSIHMNKRTISSIK